MSLYGSIMDPNDNNGGMYETWESMHEFSDVESSNFLHYANYGKLDEDDYKT